MKFAKKLIPKIIFVIFAMDGMALAQMLKPLTIQPEPPQQTPAELQRMKDFVEASRLDPLIIKLSLLTSDGRRIDCVNIEDQPSLKDMKGQKIPRAPSSMPAQSQKFSNAPTTQIMFEDLYVMDPATGKPGVVGNCPDGTVPIREVTLADLRRFPTLRDYFAKEPWTYAKTSPLPVGRTQDPPVHNGPTANHQYAHAYRAVQNWGAQTYINVWTPYTELNTEFSLGQIWVTGGAGGGLQTLEVGLQKYHNLYNDDRTHLFIYSTQDGYNRTGCYNNSCHDFVQVSTSIYPGAYINGSSVYDGTQLEIHAHWFKDMDGGAWWLNIQGQWVGYYPRTLYNAAGVQNSATAIDYGGEIIDNRNGGVHTATDMGSGQFPLQWYKRAAYMRILQYNWKTTTNPNTVWATEATNLVELRDDAACYDIKYYMHDANWGSYFFYGGPGYEFTNCH